MSEQLAEFGVHEIKGTPVVAVSGDVDISNAHTFKEALESVGHDGSVAVDLSNVQFIDSTGLNAIAQFGRVRIEQGSEVFLIVTRPPLRKIFEITSFDQHFTMLTSLDELP